MILFWIDTVKMLNSSALMGMNGNVRTRPLTEAVFDSAKLGDRINRIPYS